MQSDRVCREEPAAVFLQEVVPIALDLMQRLLPEYQSHAGRYSFFYLIKHHRVFLGNTEGYFVIILTRRDLFQVQNVEIIPYPGTNMERNLLVVHVNLFSNFSAKNIRIEIDNIQKCN